MTSSEPVNQSELQLYRVLQRANLLQYYDTFIQQGGDDVQQLCEAGEEEFLEIMALVGMAKKPLHVRRLQKALQEWVSNPVPFQQPLESDTQNHTVDLTSLSPVISVPAIVADAQWKAQKTYTAHPADLSNILAISSVPPIPTVVSSSVVIDIKPDLQNTTTTSNSAMPLTACWPPHGMLGRPCLSPSPGSPESQTGGSEGLDEGMSESKRGSSPTPSTGSGSGSNGYESRLSTSPVPCTTMSEHQVQAIANAAEKLAHSLPPLVPKVTNMRKQIAKEIEDAMNLPFDEPGRLDLMRKYGAIYGRFDSKRKNEKPMSLHEASVNEAAAHLCFHVPALLTRREELFPLARQAVRQSGYQYAKGHSRSVTAQSSGADGCSPIKRQRLDLLFKEYDPASLKMSPQDGGKREERLMEITQQLSQIASEQESLRAQLVVAKDAEEYERLHSLQAELEELMTWNAQLTAEHGHLTRLVGRTTSSRGGHKTRSAPSSIGSPDSGSHGSVLHANGLPVNSLTGGEFPAQEYYRIHTSQGGEKPTQFVRETLYDEGLRIAQQYGMSDFAAELKVLQPKGEEESENGTKDCEDSSSQNEDREKEESDEISQESKHETAGHREKEGEEENAQDAWNHDLEREADPSQDEAVTKKFTSNTVKLKKTENQTKS